MKRVVGLLLAVGLCVLNHTAQGISITYQLTALGGDHYRYTYTVHNEGSLGPGVPLQLFDLLFDPVPYLESSLRPTSAPAITAAWDEQIVPSGVAVPALYDVLATAGGLTAGAALTGFSVEFAWLGGPAGPGAQPFEVYDSITLERLESGVTASALAIPAPGTLGLTGAGALGLFALARRRRPRAVFDSFSRSRHLRLRETFMKRLVYRLAGVLGLGLLLSAAAAAQSLTIGQYTVVNSKRLDRFTFEYTYRAQVSNTGAAVRNVTATLTSTPPWVTVLEGTLSFGEVAAGAMATSQDTFLIRHDRHFPLKEADLVWTLSAEPLPPPNRRPVADAGADQEVAVNTPVYLDGSASSDPDNDPLTFQWALIPPPGGSTATLDEPTSATPSFVPDLPGLYMAQLIVNDGKLNAAAATRINVTATTNHPPLLTSTPERTTIRAGQSYRYQLTATDLDDDPLTFELSTAPSGMTLSTTGLITWTARVEGSFPVGVAVADARGARDTQAFTLTVRSADLPSSAVIGPAGGAVGLPDGATIDIPAGALSSAATISIQEIALPGNAVFLPTSVVISKVYSLEPEDLEFNRPVRITIPYDESRIPSGYSEETATLEVQAGDGQFDPAASEAPEELGLGELESPFQERDMFRNEVTVYRRSFSVYVVTAINVASEFTREVTEEFRDDETGHILTRIKIRQPENLRVTKVRGIYATLRGCEAPVRFIRQPDFAEPIPIRPGNVTGIILHSTGNPNATFIDEIRNAAFNRRNNCFAHYYISRDGIIHRVSADDRVTNHVAPGSRFLNSDAIGIELYSPYGEPYDGRQIATLVALLDHLMLSHSLARPTRDPATGVLRRNPAIDSIVTHTENSRPGHRSDPSGTFRSSNQIFATQDPLTRPLPGGSATAPALVDGIVDALVALDRSRRQDTGIINTSGGDSLGVASGGRGGEVRFTVDEAAVNEAVGEAVRQNADDNRPLIIGPGATRMLSGEHAFTDAIIAGTLEINGPLELRLYGTFYLAPNGRIVSAQNSLTANLRVFSRGTPIIQGLIDLRGRDSTIDGAPGANGGAVTFTQATPGVLLVPTMITRGGDADTAEVSRPGGGPAGGAGGNITLSMGDSHLVLGGGVGLSLITGGILAPIVPPLRSDPVNPNLPAPPSHVGDFLPPTPPLTLSSLGVTRPVLGQRVPLQKAFLQPGFTRGLLTSGGMGGAGLGSSSANQAGGPGGAGGDVALTVDTESLITLRDVDLITGADVESLAVSFTLPESGTVRKLVCPVSGSAGGVGSGSAGGASNRGGDGGPGGRAGSLTVSGTLNPAPATFTPRYTIRGFAGGTRLQAADDNCSPGNTDFGQTLEAATAAGQRLYRLRLDGAGNALGGLGGIPSGRGASGYPGDVGMPGASAPVQGLRTR